MRPEQRRRIEESNKQKEAADLKAFQDRTNAKAMSERERLRLKIEGQTIRSLIFMDRPDESGRLWPGEICGILLESGDRLDLHSFVYDGDESVAVSLTEAEEVVEVVDVGGTAAVDPDPEIPTDPDVGTGEKDAAAE